MSRSKDKPKTPTFKEIMQDAKQPKIPRNDPGESRPVWSFKWVDVGAPWCWTKKDENEAINVYPCLGSLESMTWTEIQQGRKGHPVEKDDPDLLTDAPKRLDDIGRGQYNLYSLRVTGAGRIWGIKIEEVYYVLWWDPVHAVYPREPKNT